MVTWEMVEAKAKEMGELLAACYSKEELHGVVPITWGRVDTLHKYASVKGYYIRAYNNPDECCCVSSENKLKMMEEYRETYT